LKFVALIGALKLDVAMEARGERLRGSDDLHPCLGGPGRAFQIPTREAWRTGRMPQRSAAEAQRCHRWVVAPAERDHLEGWVAVRVSELEWDQPGAQLESDQPEEAVLQPVQVQAEAASA
jgi:hypothetical protein